MFKPGEIEGIPLGIERQFSDLETRIMEDIIRRLKENGGDITRAADWQIHRLHELGVSQKEIKEYIRESLELSDRQIDEIYEKTIRAGYYRDGGIYKLKGKDQIPYKENTGLQQLIGAVTLQTNGELKNITRTMGFAKRENGQLRFTQLSDYYQKTLDGAMLDITSGAFDYNTVLKRTVRELTNSGLRTVDYASGKSLRVESAARMAVMTGVSQVTAKINEQNAKELDTEYFEVTCHGGARPTHQEWQGKVYSKKELET
ncbi:MAG: minor capsid protein, partial [Clostridia bacterium]|nr:minor capsid protein [Clostridia bacterium]